MSKEEILKLKKKYQDEEKEEKEETEKETETEKEKEKEKEEEEKEETIKKCRSKACWIIGGLSATAKKTNPHAAHTILDDETINEGIELLTQVLLIYPDAEPPEWVTKYMPHIMMIIWMSKTAYKIKEKEKELKEEAEKNDKEILEITDAR